MGSPKVAHSTRRLRRGDEPERFPIARDARHRRGEFVPWQRLGVEIILTAIDGRAGESQ